MLKVGLTGNIGSGKSTVAKIFNILGVPVYHADIEAKKFLFQNEIIRTLKNEFGESIIVNNQIDRNILASIVFNKNEALDFLNQLIHPLVKEDFDNWCKKQDSETSYIILEAAILFESNFNQYVDKNILVAADQEIRLQRVIKRDKLQKEEVLKRMKNQWEEEKKAAFCDFIIKNNENDLIIPQVIEIHKKFLTN